MKCETRALNYFGKTIQLMASSLALALTLLSLSGMQTGVEARDRKDFDEEEFNALLQENVKLRNSWHNNHWAFFYWLLDENGKVLKPLQFNSASSYSEGLACVSGRDSSRESATGYINTAGKLTVPLQFSNGSIFSEGLALVIVSSQESGYIDHGGRVIFSNEGLLEGLPFSEGLAAVRMRRYPDEKDIWIDRDNKPGIWGFVNKSGLEVIPKTFQQANSFHQGLAGVRLEKLWFFIDKNGNQVGDKYESVGSFCDNLAPVRSADKWGYILRKGKLVIPCQFEDAQDFSEGLAAVKRKGLYGFISTSGKFVIEPQFKKVDQFKSRLCAVQTESGKWGFIDKSGKLVIPAKFDDADAFFNNRAWVKTKYHVGFIDRLGRYAVEPIYEDAGRYSNNRTIARKRNWNYPQYRYNLMSKHAAGATIHKDESSPTGVYIPQNLEDALAELDKCLPAAAKEDIRAISRFEMSRFDIGYETGFYKNWNLEKGSRLTDYFKSIGVNNAREMAGLIMQTYWSKIHGLSTSLEREIAHCRYCQDGPKFEQNMSVKLPTADLKTQLKSADGKTTELGELISKAKVTVLVLCSESDTRLPEIKKLLDTLRTEYDAKLVNAFTVLDADTDSFSFPPGGPDTPEAMLAAAQASKNQRQSTKHKLLEPWTLRAEAAFFQEMDNLLGADAFMVVPILVIKNDGTVVKLIYTNGADTSTDVLTILRTYLNEARDTNQGSTP